MIDEQDEVENLVKNIQKQTTNVMGSKKANETSVLILLATDEKQICGAQVNVNHTVGLIKGMHEMIVHLLDNARDNLNEEDFSDFCTDLEALQEVLNATYERKH